MKNGAVDIDNLRVEYSNVHIGCWNNPWRPGWAAIGDGCKQEAGPLPDFSRGDGCGTPIDPRLWQHPLLAVIIAI
jgi:hypothetical protein